MRLGFRKSMKIGGMRLNLSKSGIGGSVGIKGLRVGVNAKGKTYVSGGTHGVYFRETSRSEKRTKVTNNNISADDAETNKGCILAAIGVVCFILGFVSPIFFIVPVIQIALFIREVVRDNNDKKKSEALIDVIDVCIQNEDITTLVSGLNDVNTKISTKFYKDIVYRKTYSQVINNIVKDRNISDEEEMIIKTYESNLDNEVFSQINTDVIDSIVADMLEDSTISNEEEAQFKQILARLPLSEEKQIEVSNVIKDMKSIEEFRSSGLKRIDIDDEIVRNKTCYYHESIEVLKLRTRKGEHFLESDGNAELYITDGIIDLLSEGHKKIKIKDIVSVENKDGNAELVLINRQTPIYFKTAHPLLVIAIIGELKKVS